MELRPDFSFLCRMAALLGVGGPLVKLVGCQAMSHGGHWLPALPGLSSHSSVGFLGLPPI